MPPILHARKQSRSSGAHLSIAERRRPDFGCVVFPIALPENVRVYTRGNRAGEVEREVPELARLRQADHHEGAPWPHEGGHACEAYLCIHVMERGHRSDQVKACRLELMLEEVAEDVRDSFAALSAGRLDRGRVAIDTYDAVRNSAQRTCEDPIAASDVESACAMGRRRSEDQRVVVEIVVPAIRLHPSLAIRGCSRYPTLKLSRGAKCA